VGPAQEKPGLREHTPQRLWNRLGKKESGEQKFAKRRRLIDLTTVIACSIEQSRRRTPRTALTEASPLSYNPSS
jgi:hypothetical protein